MTSIALLAVALVLIRVDFAASARRKRILLDSDLGTDADDTLALVLALTTPELTVVAVHTCGRTPVTGAYVARKLLHKMGRSDIPVYVGSRLTYNDSRDLGLYARGHEGLGILWPFETYDVIHSDPPKELYDSLDAVVAIGPLTNIARLLDKGYHIRELFVMGGSLMEHVHPTISFRYGYKIDYNLRFDPFAARRVLLDRERVQDIVLVTGNVTFTCWLKWEDLDSLFMVGVLSEAVQMVARQTRMWAPLQWLAHQTSSDNVAFLHDPLAVAVAAGSGQLFTVLENRTIEIVLNQHNVIHTLKRDSHAETNEFSRVMRVSTSVVCPAMRRFLLEKFIHYDYPERSTPYVGDRYYLFQVALQVVLVVYFSKRFVVWLLGRKST